MHWRRASVAVCGAAVMMGLVWRISAAAAQQDAGGTTTLQVFSRLTVVDVTAADANGQPVYGLKQSDFTILEDGKPQTIRNFEEVGARPVMPTGELPPHVCSNLQPQAPSPAINILLLDFANLAPVDSTDFRELSRSTQTQKRVKDGAIAAIQSMPLGTRVAVLSLTSQLRIVQSFTSDRELLAEAINATPYDLDGRGNKGGVQTDERNRSVLEAFDQVAASTAAIKARKNLIWFALGNPAVTDPSQRPAELPDHSRGLTDAYDRLTAAQVSVYPVDAGGVSALGAGHLSEDAIAEATGGVAYSESNDLSAAVLKSIDNGANYYSIAYIPPREKYDGQYHRIEVKVDRPDVPLVFRKGYYANDLAKQQLKPGLTLSLTPPPAYAGNMKAPMSRGLATSDQILFNLAVNPSSAPAKPGDPPILGTLDETLKGKHLTRYSFQYNVPAQQIKFSDGPNNTHKGSLDFDIAVYDANDKLLTGLSQLIKMTLTDKTYQQEIAGEPIGFTQLIDLPPGQLFLRVGVLDHATNKVGTLELPLQVGHK